MTGICHNSLSNVTNGLNGERCDDTEVTRKGRPPKHGSASFAYKENAMFTLERFTAVTKFTYLGKILASANTVDTPVNGAENNKKFTAV